VTEGNPYKIPQFRLKLVREKVHKYPEERVGCYDDVVKVLGDLTRDRDRETVWAIHLNGSNSIIGVEMLSMGGLHGCALTPRDVLRGVLLSGASAFVLGHNHPSGDPSPSTSDISMTIGMSKAAEMLGIPLLDHVIVVEGGTGCSMLELGLMNCGERK
jgi:DNA repair protein RadC